MTSFDPEKITFFAKTDARGQDVAFGIKAKDRQRHMYVIGKTGMGKSTLLENMAAQDIQNGEGMAFIDPHGSAAQTLLEYVPEHRIDDVVYFAPFDTENPISFNVMEDVGPDKRHLVVSGLMSTFKKIWVDAWSARMEYILTNALLAVIEYPDTTLLSVNRLFIDKAYREKVIDYVKDPTVKSFWTEEFANYTDRFAADALPAIQNKIGQFTGNPLIRNIIGQPKSSFDIRQLMDDKKILIMNLSKGLIGETNANLLGSMLTTRIYLAAMSRADLPVEQMKQMPNFYFYVDEFQSFANATFADILSEARKYHLNLIIAHQYIEQMEEDVRNAVFGNVGTTVSFRVGPFDAETLETVFAPRFEATDLVNLGFAQIYLTLMIDGIGSQPFSAKTLPPVQLPPVSYQGMVVESSRKLYGRPRVEVEKLVEELHTPTPVEDKRPPRKQNGGGNNGNGKPRFNGQNNGGGFGNGNGNNKPRKPNPPAHKSPEDLRKILSEMTQGGPQKPSNSVKVETVEEEKSEPEKPQLEKQIPEPKVEKTENKSESRQNQQKQQSKKYGKKPQNNKPPQKEEKPQTDAKADLKSALANILPKEESKQKSSPKPESENRPMPHADVVKPNSQPAKVVIEQRKNQSPEQAERLNKIRDVMKEHTRQRPTPNHQPVQKTQSPSPKTAEQGNQNQFNPTDIKRMLRHNDKERTPFQ